MLKRKGGDDVLADVDESKKAKPDSPTEESTENKSISPITEPDPPTEESTENKSTSPINEPDPPTEESTENKSTSPITEPDPPTENKSTNPTTGPVPPIEESAENKSTNPTTGPVPPTEESAENKSTNPMIGPDLPTEESTQNKPTKLIVETRKAKKPDPEDVPEYMQIIITGPPKCGKSCLVCSYMGQLFPTRHVEFLSKQYLHILPESKQPVMIWDLDARYEFTEYRHQSYKEADIALLCFNVKIPKNSQERSLENLLHPWIAELYDHCDKIPIILVGLKREYRRKYNSECFSQNEIDRVLRRYQGIVSYKEVSAHADKDSVKELFVTAINFIDEPKPKLMYTNHG